MLYVIVLNTATKSCLSGEHNNYFKCGIVMKQLPNLVTSFSVAVAV